MVLMRERIGKLLEYLQEQIYPRSCEIQDYRMKKTEDTFTDLENLDTSDWSGSLPHSNCSDHLSE